MDVKTRQLHGKVIATGIADVPIFHGSLQKIAVDFIQWCITQRIQQDSSGELQINLRISNLPQAPLKDSAAEDFKNHPMYARMIQDIPMATEEQEQEYQDSLNLPWKADPNWWKFSELGATQSNYESNAEEYERLWNHFTTTWPQLINHLKRRSR